MLFCLDWDLVNHVGKRLALKKPRTKENQLVPKLKLCDVIIYITQ